MNKLFPFYFNELGCHWEIWGAIIFCILLSFPLFYFIFNTVLSKTVSVLRIVEYFTISMLYYFKDTLANVGLHEAWMEWDLNFVARIENK